MSIVRIVFAVLILFGLPRSAHSETRFANPAIELDGVTFPIDFCFEWGNSCGQPVADLFCRLSGFHTARSYSISQDIGAETPTYVAGAGRVCDAPACDGFKEITCITRREQVDLWILAEERRLQDQLARLGSLTEEMEPSCVFGLSGGGENADVAEIAAQKALTAANLEQRADELEREADQVAESLAQLAEEFERERPSVRDADETCHRAVQGQIAWDPAGRRRDWDDANVERLCRGAERSRRRADCFNRFMDDRRQRHEAANWRDAITYCVAEDAP